MLCASFGAISTSDIQTHEPLIPGFHQEMNVCLDWNDTLKHLADTRGLQGGIVHGEIIPRRNRSR